MTAGRTRELLEVLPIAIAAAAAIFYFPSLGLSSTFGLVGLPLAGFALARGVRRWVAALGMIVNAPLALIALLILFFAWSL